MDKTKYFFLVTLSVLSFSLYAQCPQGMPNTPGCIPPDEMDQRGFRVRDPYPASSRTPQNQWVTQWGAVAIDDVNSNLGVIGVTNNGSKRQAERAALSECRRKGG
jgi:hypothetical protein